MLFLLLQPLAQRSPWSGMCLCLVNIYASFGIPHGHSLLPRPSLSPRLGLALLHTTSHLHHALLNWASQVAQMVKNTPAMQETQV